MKAFNIGKNNKAKHEKVVSSDRYAILLSSASIKAMKAASPAAWALASTSAGLGNHGWGGMRWLPSVGPDYLWVFPAAVLFLRPLLQIQPFCRKKP